MRAPLHRRCADASRVASAALVLASLGALGGCAEPLQAPEQFGVCTERRVTALFAQRCAECHDADQPEAGLDLVSPGVSGRLVGVLSTSRPCLGRPRIDRDGGSYHLLLDKLRPSPGCGLRMPKAGAYLTLDESDCVRAWVEAAAAGGTL